MEPPPTPAAPDRSPRLLSVLGASALALPVLGLFWSIHHYAVNTIFADQWFDIDLIRRFHSGTLNAGAIWAQHGENRILVPNLIVLLLAESVHFNIVFEDYLSGLMLVAATALIIGAHKRRSPSTPWIYYFPVVIVVISMNQGGMVLFGFAISWYLVILGLAAALFLLDSPRFTWIVLAGAVLVTIAASFSDLEGLFIWPVGVFMLYQRRRSQRAFLVWILAALATTSLYWYHLHVNVHQAYAFGHPLLTLRFFFFAIGNVAGVPVPVVPSATDYVFVALGVIIFVLAVWVLVDGVRRRAQPAASPIGVSLVLFGLLYTVALTGSRVGFGLPVLPRYAIWDLLMLAGCYLSILDGFRLSVSDRVGNDRAGSDGAEQSTRGAARLGSGIRTKSSGRAARLGLVVAVVTVVCVQVVVGTYEALQSGRTWHDREVSVADITVNIHHAPNGMVVNQLGSGTEPASFLRSMAAYAKRERLSLFSTGAVAQYANEGLPRSPTPPVVTVTSPDNGATLRGVKWLLASASDSFGVAKVRFEVEFEGRPYATIPATSTSFGWLGGWNTATVPNGQYGVRSIATDSSGRTATSSPVTVTVEN